jgi:acetyl-CoA carboxylase carboxyl transferase subunit alpha
MPELKKRQFLDFEKPIKDLYDQIEQIKTSGEKNKTDVSGYVQTLEQKIIDTKRDLTANLTP